MKFQVNNTITNDTATFNTLAEARNHQQAELSWHNTHESKSSAYDEDDIRIDKVFDFEVYNNTSGHVFGVYEAVDGDQAIQQVIDEASSNEPAGDDIIAHKLQYKIHDHTANDGYGYLSIEGKITYDGDNAWEFDTEQEAQQWIADNNAQNWATIIRE